MSSSRLGPLLDALLHHHDTPTRTAAAFALGVFFSFSPFIGLQILLAMALAFLCRLNRLAVFVGLNANLPWFLIPWYAGTTLAAAWLLGHSAPQEIWAQVEQLFAPGWTSAAFFGRATALLQTTLVPLLVGPTAGAAVVGLVSFALARRVLNHRRLTHVSETRRT